MGTLVDVNSRSLSVGPTVISPWIHVDFPSNFLPSIILSVANIQEVFISETRRSQEEHGFRLTW